MFNGPMFPLSLYAMLAVGVGATFAQRPSGREATGDVYSGIKSRSDFRQVAGRPYWGVVDKITEKSVTLRRPNAEAEAREGSVELFPVTRLIQGKTVDYADGHDAYLWSDMKVGDTVQLHGVADSDEKKLYCYSVCIERRPSGKLPYSQQPKKDHRHAQHSLLNDITNGNDVSDDDIASAFPPTLAPAEPGQPKFPPILLQAGGLTPEYQAKLDAIRAKKKEAELKAPPPTEKK